MTEYEQSVLFGGVWVPAAGTSVPEALRMLADGATIDAVTLAEDQV